MKSSVWMRGVSAALLLAGSPASAGISGRMAGLVNGARSTGGICSDPVAMRVAPSGALERAAAVHAREMARKGRIGHEGFRSRLQNAGFAEGAENVASGVGLTPRKVLEMWLRSPAHCRNLLNGRYDRIGVARARRGRVEYWALILGRKR